MKEEEEDPIYENDDPIKASIDQRIKLEGLKSGNKHSYMYVFDCRLLNFLI